MILLLLISMVLTTCSELYEPKTDYLEDILVVNALVTDDPTLNYVILNLTSKTGNDPLSGATVYVADNDNNKVFFSENMFGGQGIYHAPPGFAAEQGKSYQLTVITPNGLEYESLQQTLLPVLTTDSIYAEKVFKDFLVPTRTGGAIKQSIPGMEVYGDYENSSDEMPKFRLNITLLLMYEYAVATTSNTMFFCWKKLNIENTVNINTPRFEIGADGIRRHSIGFLPVRKSHYGLKEEEHFSGFILILRQFRLNEDAYLYYKGIKEQLSAEGKLFDPIAAQLKGNIRSKSNPKDLALGFFEVSSTKTETYRLNSSIYSNEKHHQFRLIPDLESLSKNGCVMDIPPYFWFY